MANLHESTEAPTVGRLLQYESHFVVVFASTPEKCLGDLNEATGYRRQSAA